MASPKSGVVPRVFGAVFVVLTATDMVIQLRGKDGQDKGFANLRKAKAAAFILTCIGYVVLLDVIGYIPATILALFTLIKLTAKGWLKPIAVAVLVTLLFYFIFHELLSVPLP